MTSFNSIKRLPFLCVATALLSFGGSPATAQLGRVSSRAAQDAEIALALSACPPAIAARAGVYVLGPAGYLKVRDGSNGFNALVQHSMPGAQEPQCMDAEGSRTVLQRYLKVAAWRASGKTPEEIKDLTAEAFASGLFPPISRPGIDYMLSQHNEVSNFLGQVTHFPPHVMFFGTHLRNADIGVGKELGADGNPIGAVFVAAEGSPYAMVIVPVATNAHAHPAAADGN
jgi:hypothetical protein